jgi:superfamily II DNA or RNA helicase
MYELPTEFDEKLLEYQKQAVKVLARRIDRNGGAILGDVVGLGKTLTAVATAALLGAENPRFTTLVVCPVNLEGMWDSILSFHKINFKVVPYSQVKKVLPELMRYDFVIFDESHYLRNHKTDHYTAISEYLAREQPKVLLLSATPLNTKFRDVANQLGLYIDDDKDMGFEPENALAASPASFNRMAGKLRTFAAFRLSNEALDWSRLLGDHMVRRTRTYIKKNYAQKDFKGEFLQFGDGSKFYFPKRESVVVEHSFGAEDPALAMASDDTLVQIENLVLPRNDLFKYVQENLFVTAEEIKILDRLRLSRSNLLGIARTSLYKRLSSGGFSFIVSLRRHLARNLAWIYAIENGFPVPIGAKSESSLDDFDDIDDEEDDYESEVENTQEQDFKIFGERAYKIIKSTAPKKMTWVDPSYFKTTLGEALRKDSEVISSLLENFGEWTFEGDSKLIKLVELIESDYKNKKVLIFTEYKDSAKYVNEGLKYFGVQKTEVVTSETKNPTNTARRFSPASNDFMVGPDVVEGTEINVLVTTDVLSEGQNLQDSHIVINFDLPWAIIKLVQRAGRVDRVGQKSDVIKVVSFVHESIDRVIKLRSAIRSRLGNVARAIGNDEVFLGDASEISDLDKLIAGSDEDKDVDVDVDAVSAAYEVWKRVANDDPVLANRIAEMPNALYSTRDSRPSDSHDLVSFSRTNSRVNLFTGSKRLEIASQERVKGISEIEALQHFFAHPDTPTMPRQNDHFELLSDAVDEMINQASNGYGKLDYVRRTLIASLSKSANRGVLEALDEIRQRPLTQTASTVLARALRSKRDKSALEAMILALSDDGELCLDLDEFDDSLELVLSLGIVK